MRTVSLVLAAALSASALASVNEDFRAAQEFGLFQRRVRVAQDLHEPPVRPQVQLP
jgi:hypothetical protein